MEDSLEKLFNLFPWFFDKSETSNFYKSQDVTNRRFQELSNDLFKIHESFHLNKRLLIWKEQVEAYKYTIHFVASFPNLKSVTLYKNDDVIYTESFEYEDQVSNFEYSYKGNTVNDGYSNLIIPTDTFRIFVETYDEYSLVKGFPENDTILGDEFDHDISLDRIGEFNDIPRKEYIPVNQDLYPATEPPYNDRLTEDDYHYMERMLEYNLRLHDTPAPILEIWKLYGINATMENRERLLIKMFDLEKHPNFIDNRKDSNGEYLKDGDRWFSGTLNSTTGEIIEWTPEKWEHKDKFCDYEDNLGEYFFIKTSTRIPVKKQNVIFYFKFLDSLGRPLEGEYTVDIKLDNKTIVSNYVGEQYTLLSTSIPEDKDNDYIITAKNSNGEVIGEIEITISVRGCNNGDFYVSPSGNDNNDGTSRSKPFKTIQKAVNSVNGDQNLIIVLTGEYEITKGIALNQSCMIVGCGSVLIDNFTKNQFFTIPSGGSLVLQDLTLQYLGDVCNVEEISFENNNGDGSNADVMVLFTNAPYLVMTKLLLTIANRTYHVGDTITYNGTLKDRSNNALESKTVRVLNDSYSGRTYYTTDSNGAYSGTVTAKRPGIIKLSAYFDGDENYKSSRATVSVPIDIRVYDILKNYDYVVMDLTYDKATMDWKYTTKPVSEIHTLADLSGAVLKPKYTSQMDVTFERFVSYSTSESLTKTDLTNLQGLLVGILYDDYNVEYTIAKLYGTTKITQLGNPIPPSIPGVSSAAYGRAFTIGGKLLDEYSSPLVGKIVQVNGVNCTTDSDGIFSCSLTFQGISTKYIVKAEFAGDDDYESETRSVSLPTYINLSDILDDFDYIVTDMTYNEETRDWDYTTKPVSEIQYCSDLNGAIMNLNFYENNVQFERFEDNSTNMTYMWMSRYQLLDGLLVGIEYDDYTIEYTKYEVN